MCTELLECKNLINSLSPTNLYIHQLRLIDHLYHHQDMEIDISKNLDLSVGMLELTSCWKVWIRVWAKGERCKWIDKKNNNKFNKKNNQNNIEDKFQCIRAPLLYLGITSDTKLITTTKINELFKFEPQEKNFYINRIFII